MMKILISIAMLVIASCMTLPAYGESHLYINYAPDTRYSGENHDSRIAFELSKELYSYGHDYGKLAACAGDLRSCITFDFMALYELPDDAAVGAEYAGGHYKFSVVRKVELSLLGSQHKVLRVDVAKDGEHTNSYLTDPRLGVIAIVIPNFGNKEVPESIFFLTDDAGVFAKHEQ